MKKFLLLITIIASLASCRSPQQLADRKCTKAQLKYEKAAYRWGCPLVAKSDTVIKETTIRVHHDTTIYVFIKADTVRSVDTVYQRNGLAQTDQHRLDTEYAYSIAYVLNGLLFHTLYQKPAEIAKTIRDAIQRDSHVEYKTITKTVVTKINYLTQWQIFQLWLGRIAFGILIVVAIVKGIQFYIKRYMP